MSSYKSMIYDRYVGKYLRVPRYWYHIHASYIPNRSSQELFDTGTIESKADILVRSMEHLCDPG
jgi:hypothetical protein